MQKYHLYSCRGEDLKYDAVQQAFVCHNESEIYGRKRAADAGYMQEHFEQLLLRAIQAKGGVPNEKLTYAGSENASDYVTSSDWLSENVYAYNYKDEYLMFTLRVTITKDANGEKIYTPEVTDLVIRPTTSRDE